MRKLESVLKDEVDPPLLLRGLLDDRAEFFDFPLDYFLFLSASRKVLNAIKDLSFFSFSSSYAFRINFRSDSPRVASLRLALIFLSALITSILNYS